MGNILSEGCCSDILTAWHFPTPLVKHPYTISYPITDINTMVNISRLSGWYNTIISSIFLFFFFFILFPSVCIFTRALVYSSHTARWPEWHARAKTTIATQKPPDGIAHFSCVKYLRSIWSAERCINCSMWGNRNRTRLHNVFDNYSFSFFLISGYFFFFWRPSWFDEMFGLLFFVTNVWNV